MLNIKKICLTEGQSVRTAVEVMNESGRQIVLIVDQNKVLLGTFTDGDLRRALLNDVTLDTPLKGLYHHPALSSPESKGRYGAVEMMREHGVDQMPLVDAAGRITSVELINPAQHGIKIDNTVVIMAGGMGKRLYPITESVPKALVPVGSHPILELIIERLASQGFQNFIISVNYLGEMIEDYFGDGSKWDVSITYLTEKKRLGTAGALSLIEKVPDKPILILNCDVLTTTSFQDMISFHEEKKATMSMGVQEYYHQVPYGVVRIDGTSLQSIDEKPESKNFVNAGMYVVSPEVLKYVPKDQYYDMTDFIDLLLKEKKSVHCYPIKKYWIDVGNPNDLERARSELHLHF